MSACAWGESPVPVLRGLEGMEPRARIDPSPFAGLIIVLLITYMVLTPSGGGHQLPRAHSAQVVPGDLPAVGIDLNGVLYLADRRVPDAAFPAEAQAEMGRAGTDAILLKARGEADYAHVERALRGLRAAGVRRVILEAYPPRSR
jgi:biopolymer transport protein ExbD